MQSIKQEAKNSEFPESSVQKVIIKKRWFLIAYQTFDNIIKPFLSPLLYFFERRIAL